MTQAEIRRRILEVLPSDGSELPSLTIWRRVNGENVPDPTTWWTLLRTFFRGCSIGALHVALNRLEHTGYVASRKSAGRRLYQRTRVVEQP